MTVSFFTDLIWRVTAPLTVIRKTEPRTTTLTTRTFHQFVYGVSSVFILLHVCLQCFHTFTFMLHPDRTGGALQRAPSIDRLPVIGIDETVHDQPAYEDPPDEPRPPSQDAALPGPQQVLSEETLIGAKASIVYEDCLRQLASFLVLPVEKCSGGMKTGETCDCVAPFEINIAYKGTATSVEWVSLDSHHIF